MFFPGYRCAGSGLAPAPVMEVIVMNTRQLFAMFAVAALVGTAVAVPPWVPRVGPPAFADIDADGSGAITAQEFDRFRANRMAQRAAEGYRLRNAGQHPGLQAMDLDADQVVSEQEFYQWRAARMANRR